MVPQFFSFLFLGIATPSLVECDSSLSEASALLQATASVLVDSDAEFELDVSDANANDGLVELEVNMSIANDGGVQHINALETGSELASVHMLGRLHRTTNRADCLARANAHCFHALSGLAGCVSKNLARASEILNTGLLLQSVGMDAPVVWATSAAEKWQATSDKLLVEMQEFEDLADESALDAKVSTLSTLIGNLGIQAQEDEILFCEAHTQCQSLTPSLVSDLCAPLEDWCILMNGHKEKSDSDLLILNQLHDAVKASPELALLQGRHVTSVTQSDKLSIKAVHTLMRLAKHQLNIEEQVQKECQEFKDTSATTVSVAKRVPGTDMSGADAAVAELSEAAAATCPN